MTLLVQGVLDITVVLLLALAAMPLLRRQSAALRHCVLTAALVSGATLPLIEPVLPDWRLPVQLPTPGVLELTSSVEIGATRAVPGANITRPVATPASSSRFLATLLSVVWVSGSVIAFGALAFALARLDQLARKARVVDDPRWLSHLAGVSAALHVRRPVRLLESRDPRFLVVWGISQPRVLLPVLARDWPDDRIRLVLTHELAHVRRGDWLVQCLGELIRAVYWFHPLVWVVCTRLRQESDHACDDLVLAGGVEGPEYAAHLVDVARVLRHQRAWLPAPAIAHITGFERRVQAMLDAHVNRCPLSRRTLVVVFASTLLLALPIAALTAAQALVSFSGSVLDPSNAVLPNAVITLTNVESQAKYEVRTNRDGRYEIPGLPSGRYVLQSTVPGFDQVRLDLTVGGENVQRDLKLDLGAIQETITIANGPAAPPKEMTPEQKAKLEERIRNRAAQRCPEGAATTPAIGGNIRVPMKVRDVRPVFPPALASGGASGKVELQALIGTDGRVDRITVQSASHQEFADAAADAVRQWEFDATLLNCVPIETRMNVTANFVQR